MDLKLVFGVLEAGLQLWASKEKTKYQDKYIQLKRDFYEEYNKDFSIRNDAILDSIRSELFILCDSFATAVKAENTKN